MPFLKPTASRRARKIILFSILALVLLCVAGVLASYISNRTLPVGDVESDRLSDMDKARLLEVYRMRAEHGSAIWPGLENADIPLIAYNARYAFLVGYPNPPDGWNKVPAGDRRGGPWEEVPGDWFNGQPYYRQPIQGGVTPEAFTVKVGERWVASMATLDFTRTQLMGEMGSDMPGFLAQVFPYRLVFEPFFHTDFYVITYAHESFHAFQGMTFNERLAAAENANRQFASQYPFGDATNSDARKLEAKALEEALRAKTDEEALAAARKFLELRRQRRTGLNLSPQAVSLEKLREWEEGLAKYVELETWRQASLVAYPPDGPLMPDAGFQAYRTFESRFKQESGQVSSLGASPEDNSFYYTGMAQAFLLDRLSPGWKQHAFDEAVFLEDLLAQAVR